MFSLLLPVFFLSLTAFCQEDLIPIYSLDNEKNEKFRTLKTDIQLSSRETEQLLELLQGESRSIKQKGKKKHIVDSFVTETTREPENVTTTDIPCRTTVGIKTENSTFDQHVELLARSTTSSSIPVETIPTSNGTDEKSLRKALRKTKVRKILSNDKDLKFYKLHNNEFKFMKKRLIKEKFEEEFDDIVKRLMAEQINATIKAPEAIKAKETPTVAHNTAKGSLQSGPRKPLAISPIEDREPLHSLLIIRNGRLLSLSRKQQKDIDIVLRTLVPLLEMEFNRK